MRFRRVSAALALFLLAGAVFAAFFAIGRAFRGDPTPEPSPPAVVDAQTPRLVDLGLPSRIPALRPAAQPPQAGQ